MTFQIESKVRLSCCCNTYQTSTHSLFSSSICCTQKRVTSSLTLAGVGDAQAAQPGIQGQKRKRRLLLATMDRDMEGTVPPVSLQSEDSVQAQPGTSSHANAAAQLEGEEGTASSGSSIASLVLSLVFSAFSIKSLM